MTSLRSYVFAAAMIAIVLVIMIFGPARASSCNAIRDFDRRAECLGIERRDPSGCTSIRNPDDREVCRRRAGQRDLFGRERR